MTDIARIQSILADFRKRMQKNGSTNKARWNAFTSLPSVSPVQLTRRLNSYGITTTNREVAELWKYVGIKTNSMKYDDFVKMLQADTDDAPMTPKGAKKQRAPKPTVTRVDDDDDYNDYNDSPTTSHAVARPRLGMNDSGQKPARPQSSKPHVTIDPRFIQPNPNQQLPQRTRKIQREEPEEDFEDDIDEERGESLYNYMGNAKRYSDDDDEAYRRPQSKKVYSPPKRSNKSGIDDDIINQGTYDSGDEYEGNNANRNYRKYNDDDDENYRRPYNDDDDDDAQYARQSPTKGPKKQSQDPEIFSRIPSSNSPNRSPPTGARGRLDPTIFGGKAASDSDQLQQTVQHADSYKGAEQVSGLSLKKLISLITEHVYNSYPNSKSCFLKWRGMHNNLEAEDLRDGLARDANILISSEDAKLILRQYGGPMSMSAFARLLSDGSKYEEELKSGPQELTDDEAALLKIAEQIHGNKWEDMIYKAHDAIDIVNCFAELGVNVTTHDIRVLTSKYGKTGLVNAIKSLIE